MLLVYIDDIFTIIIAIIIAFVIPGCLTIWNIYNCFSKNPKKEKWIATITIIIGGMFYFLLKLISFEEAGDWYKQISIIQYHNTISSEYSEIAWIVVLGLAGYFLLLFKKADKLPPLVAAVSISMLILLNLFQIAYAIQIKKNIHDIEYLLYVYHINILILSARVIYLHMKQQVEIFRSRTTELEQHKRFNFFFGKIDNLVKYNFFIFVVLFFVIAVIEIIFILAGQGADAPIKAFTDTADWTFSKQTPPPPVDYEGRYLCTVAAGGHRRIVKPLRLGKRRGKTIVVNRQLCIANAFEELIQEKFPRFHKKIRFVYDKYGYPISRIIKSPLKADIVYFIMKPLEWCFLLYLYMADLRPEERIRRQYAFSKE